MLNHPTLKDHVGQNDEECLMHLNEVDVQEIDDDTYQGFKYVFRFGLNEYFENRELFKQFKYNKATGDLMVDQTEIKWKPGKNLCDPKDVSQLIAGKQAGKKRALEEDETSDFFSWFDKDNEDEEFIGQPMKDIWEEPVKFFAGDVDDFDDEDDYDDDELPGSSGEGEEQDDEGDEDEDEDEDESEDPDEGDDDAPPSKKAKTA
eukprot:Tamp_06000.p3 GENE.Tamp_06000~~Tamp_06000.p3  ORF type:complete len:204 (-),score=88.68 Tamp_06000:1069-1680(-)